MSDSSAVGLACSAARFAWATFLFGAERLSGALAGGVPRQRAARSLYAIGAQAQEYLGDSLWATFLVGDGVQRMTTDLMFDLVTAPVTLTASLHALIRDVAVEGAESAQTWSNAANRHTALTQLGNNLDVYRMVTGVREVLHLPDHGLFPLAGAIADAYAVGRHASLWAIEGVGYQYADRWWDTHPTRLEHILESDKAGAIPASSLTMLHAGIGLAFARRVLRTLTPSDPAPHLRDGVERFLRLCRVNSRPGYEGAAFESLGLVARTWHAPLVGPLDRQLAALDDRARESFWHGAGRALYFHPLYIVPGTLSPWHAADREPPDDVARLNMKAGLAWATALVNMQDPHVLQRLIDLRGPRLADDDAFQSGVASALMMAIDVAGGSYGGVTFGHGSPTDGRGTGPASWDSLIGEPWRYATSGLRGVLSDHLLLGELFRYHRFPDWFARALVDLREPDIQ